MLRFPPPAVIRLLLVLGIASPAWCSELRVETDIYVGNQKKPVAQNLTLFTSGLVYDFPLVGPKEVTVFDPAHGRFVLLDCRRKVKTMLTTNQILEFASAIRAQAHQIGGVIAFAAEPEFDEAFDAESGRLTLTSQWLTYRVKTIQPDRPAAAASYRSFADWYARLNATRPGSLPPFARLELNKALAQRALVPQEVELIITPKHRQGDRKLVIRSRHNIDWHITNTDRKRIEEAGSWMASFQAVSFRDYERELLAAASRGDHTRQ